MRIKEILSEKKISINQLAEKLGVTRQTLHRQMKGKLLVETAERIATALDVPLWRLFVSPDEICSQPELHALIEYKGKLYKASTLDQLAGLLSEWRGEGNS